MLGVRRRGREAEGTRLLNEQARKGLEGSNPSVSAIAFTTHFCIFIIFLFAGACSLSLLYELAWLGRRANQRPLLEEKMSRFQPGHTDANAFEEHVSSACHSWPALMK
jgi:hypothetical protein